MKSRRFLSVFFSLLLLFSLITPAYAAEGDRGEGSVAAKAVLLIDPETEEVLFARNIYERMYPASLTKVMTALLVLEAVEDGVFELTTPITASETAIANLPADGSNAGIKVGESFTVEELLHCILVVSANEACDILAEAISGNVDSFVARMNRRAEELGCQDTHFENTNGLHSMGHYTTAWDLYLITNEARRHDAFRTICATRYFTLPATELCEARTFHTTNYLISTARNASYLYKGATGLKTGSTSDAGYCLIATAERNDRQLLSVVLGAERVTLEDGTKDTQSFSETVRLLDMGFYNYSRQTILEEDELVAEVSVNLSQQQNYVKVHPAEGVQRLLPSDLDLEQDVQRKIQMVSESVDAPIEKGQVLGTITLVVNDVEYATVDLLADESVEASRLLVFKRDAIAYLQQPWIYWTVGGVLLLAVVAIVVSAISRRRRRYSSYRNRNQGRNYRGRRR